ncbi:hypothetical protein [Flavobacterium granuli]|uniref:Protein required for attachment to host cells n=1 Tax=Flavobacterium granuli TaxID=280093 RepID=A0A1M5K2J8_9FLAO|nr:hypothetical protein [Flavobacterium granuli]PRZ26136.1 hypothetical protein BC624_10298 [Flavobacterium granuli]SHG46759.1 hypothetical protein SAMN05443373_10298 [Flavobacterium granuli]
MKKQAGIWIDSTKAIIVTLNGGKETVTEIQSDLENRVYHDKEGDKGSFFGNQHIDSQKTFDERKKHQTNAYLKDVISNVHGADELYIFGPAETKTKLEKKINEDKSTIAGKLKSVETADNNMTSNQIVAKVKKFYNQ